MKLVWHVTLTRDSAGRPEDPAPLWEAVSAFGDAITRRPSALVEPFEEVVRARSCASPSTSSTRPTTPCGP